MKIIIKIVIISLMFFLVGCSIINWHGGDPYQNEYNLPLKSICKLLDSDISDLVEVKELRKYIVSKDYDFFVLTFDDKGFDRYYTIAELRDGNLYFFLNYPKLLSFNNYNMIAKEEKYNITDKAYVLIYIKFISKLFIPTSIGLDEVAEAIQKGDLPNKLALLKLEDSFKTNITIDIDGNIDAEFYTLNKEHLMYNWQLQMGQNGVLKSFKVTMLSLNSSYNVDNEIVIFEQKFNGKAKKEDNPQSGP